MINVDGKVYRNIQEQVEKNQEDVVNCREIVAEQEERINSFQYNYASKESVEKLLHQVGDIQGFDFDSVEVKDGVMSINGLIDTKETIIKVETPFDITQTTWSGNIDELKTLRDKLSNNSNITSLKVYIKDEQYNSWWEEVKIINKTPYVSNPNQIYALEFIASRPINSSLCVFSIVGNQYRLIKIIS